jgi:ubiquitin C-terminal hydrolase
MAIELKDTANHIHQYELRGIVDHIGTDGTGHYIAKCWNENSRDWILFDDTEVTKISPSILVSRNSYVLSYVQTQ